jgi:hypothetical protein
MRRKLGKGGILSNNQYLHFFKATLYLLFVLTTAYSHYSLSTQNLIYGTNKTSLIKK